MGYKKGGVCVFGGVSLWPEAMFMLLNLDRFIHTCKERVRKNERRVYPSPLYVHEPAVCVWGLPWQPRPHPLFLPNSAYESHLCRPLISISTRSPLGLYAVCVCFWTEITGRERWCREQRKHGIITTVKSDFGALIMMICAVCALQIHANANRYSYFH